MVLFGLSIIMDSMLLPLFTSTLTEFYCIQYIHIIMGIISVIGQTCVFEKPKLNTWFPFCFKYYPYSNHSIVVYIPSRCSYLHNDHITLSRCDEYRKYDLQTLWVHCRKSNRGRWTLLAVKPGAAVESGTLAAATRSDSCVEASDGRPYKSINYLPGLLIIQGEVLVSDADI